MYSPIFDDIYTTDILIDFDYSNVDFSKVQKNEKEVEKKDNKSKVEA